MYKINQKNKTKLGYVLNLFILILIIFFNKNNVAFGADNNWIEVSKTNSGIQYLDRASLNSKDKEIIEIRTKYLKINSNSSKNNEENIYIMRINCLTNKFKDISANGKEIINAKWENPNGDKLIIDLISESCKNVSSY